MKKYLFMMMAALLSLPIAAQEQPKNNTSIQADTNIRISKIFIRGHANIEKQVKNLYIIDGVVTSKGTWDRIPKEKIKSLNTFRNVEQVFVIETQTGQAPKSQFSQSALKVINPKLVYQYSDSNNSLKITHDFDSTVINSPSVSQIITTHAKMPLWIVKNERGKFKVISEKEVHDMDIKLIKTMNIFKGSEAESYKKYGDISNGVVVIEFKNK